MSDRLEGRVAVIGGGLAGIAAALSIARAGADAVLLEQRPFLGGRVFSFEDPDTGATIDNGQHVLVGSCARLRAFLRAIGSPADAFVRQPRLRIPILDATGRAGWVRAPRLPAPLHLAAALYGYRHLDARSKWAIARAVRELATSGAAERAEMEPLPLGAWLASRGMPARAIERFWEPLVRPALNIPVASANLPLTAFFLEHALWAGPESGALWLPSTGLSEALGEPAARALARANVDVRAGTRVQTILVEGGRAVGVGLADGGRLDARAVVSAVPPRILDAILPASVRPNRPHAMIGSSAIINVYLWYDRPVTELAFAGTFGSPLQWVFNRARLLGTERSGGECLGVSLSAADDCLEWSKETLADRCDEALAALFPARRGASRTRFAVVKEPHATFCAAPDIARLRPGPVGPCPGLFLAGDWTDTGWPATMEGAVASGEAAAGALLADGAISRAPAPAAR
ncbi:hydroxysqualene dehydroxylase HpnE [soil metagenome]